MEPRKACPHEKINETNVGGEGRQMQGSTPGPGISLGNFEFPCCRLPPSLGHFLSPSTASFLMEGGFHYL